MSAERIRQLVARLGGEGDEGSVSIEDEAVELLDELLSRYVGNTLDCASNQRSSSSQPLRVSDLRAYPQNELGLDVLGFASDVLQGEDAKQLTMITRYSVSPPPPSSSSPPPPPTPLKGKSASAAAGSLSLNRAHADRLQMKHAALQAAAAAAAAQHQQQLARAALTNKKKKKRITATRDVSA